MINKDVSILKDNELEYLIYKSYLASICEGYSIKNLS